MDGLVDRNMDRWVDKMRTTDMSMDRWVEQSVPESGFVLLCFVKCLRP